MLVRRDQPAVRHAEQVPALNQSGVAQQVPALMDSGSAIHVPSLVEPGVAHHVLPPVNPAWRSRSHRWSSPADAGGVQRGIEGEITEQSTWLTQQNKALR